MFNCCFGVLLYCTSLCTFDDGDNIDVHSIPSPSRTAPIPASLFLAQLPLRWIEKVLCADALVTPSEYERYRLAKRIFQLRSSFPHLIPTEQSQQSPFCQQVSSHDEDYNTSQDENEPETHAEPEDESFSIAGLIEKVLTNVRPKKRKMEEPVTNPPKDSDSQARKRLKSVTDNALSSPTTYKPESLSILPTTQAKIYEKGIIYTYMTFQQLGVVKSDEIVPFHLALESFWLQTELSGQLLENRTHKLPPFRFSIQFNDISKHFRSTPRPQTMASESVVCAGVQYRLLLALDKDQPHEPTMVLKALLQKSKGKGPKLDYAIYCFDHRLTLTGHGMDELVNPVTHCGKNGDGYSNDILLNPIKQEDEVDRLILSVVLTFE
ncbi:hypothetical protein HDU91_003487 [Kappamyces sp. JEL0680]|nr:hypothetical protein HDU91_003487 [Kappamyces sp. JEL0680]